MAGTKNNISDVIKKLLSSGEASERTLELCVPCPLYEKNVPVIGNCFYAKISSNGHSPDNTVKLHGRPSDFSYDLKQKCEYALDFTKVMLTKNLKSVICKYKPKL